MDKRIIDLRNIVMFFNEVLEFETCTIEGVDNISRGDRDLILLSLRTLELNGRVVYNINGRAEEVLKRAGLFYYDYN